MSTGPERENPILDASACWSLLRSSQVGRIAVSAAARPEIFPVNYLVDHGTIVFRTAEGTKLAAVVAFPQVAFEIDGYDPAASVAWSVLIAGRARIIERTHELIDMFSLPLFPWHAGPKPRFVRIVPDEVSGRRFHVVAAASWLSPLSGVPHAPSE